MSIKVRAAVETVCVAVFMLAVLWMSFSLGRPMREPRVWGCEVHGEEVWCNVQGAGEVRYEEVRR